MTFLTMQAEGWPAHAYHPNKILLGLKSRRQREKQAETGKFSSIKRSMLRCWAWSQKQSFLQHGSPDYLETVRKRNNLHKSSDWKKSKHLPEGTLHLRYRVAWRYYLKKKKQQNTTQLIWNITEAASKGKDRTVFHTSYMNTDCSEKVIVAKKDQLCCSFILSVRK